VRSFSSCWGFYLLPAILSISPSTTNYGRLLLHKMWPVRLAFLSFYCMQNVVFLLDSVKCLILHTTDQKDLVRHSPAPQFNFKRMYDLFFRMYNFHHHKNLCSNGSISLVSSLHLSPIWWRKEFYPCYMPLLLSKSWI